MNIFLNGALFLTIALQAAPKIEVLKIHNSPHNDNIILRRMYSENGLVSPKFPLVLQVGEFPIGVSLPNRPEDLRGMRESSGGSTILLWVYAEGGYQKRFYLTKDDATSFIEDKTYFKDRFRKYFKPEDLPGVAPGKIVISGMLINGYGESIKTEKSNKSVIVDYLERTGENKVLEGALKAPRIAYNEPYGNFQKDHPILLDFYVFNADIGSDAYTVDLYIDGKKEETLHDWAPYKIRNLEPGRHEIQLILIDPHKNPAPEPFGPHKNTIFVGS
jgi:hypothetical protein